MDDLVLMLPGKESQRMTDIILVNRAILNISV